MSENRQYYVSLNSLKSFWELETQEAEELAAQKQVLIRCVESLQERFDMVLIPGQLLSTVTRILVDRGQAEILADILATIKNRYSVYGYE